METYEVCKGILQTLFQKYKLELTTGIQTCIDHAFVNIRDGWWLGKRCLKSEFAFFQSLSWLFQLTYFVKCKRTLLELNSYQPHPSSERKRKFCHCLFTSTSKREIRYFHVVVVLTVTVKKCTKKRDARAKLLFCLVKLLLFWRSRCRHRRGILKSVLFTTVIGQKRNLHLKRFSDSSVVPSFLVRKVQNEIFPCTHNLGKQTREVWRDNSRVLTKRTLEMLIANWEQSYKAFFVPNQEPAFVWPFGNGPVRVGTQGLFRLCLKTFAAPFLSARLTGPRSPRMVW